MDEKKLYSDKRWTEPIACKVVGYIEMTPEEHEEADKTLKEMIKKFSGDKD